MKTCPFCAEEIQEAAIKCKHCGEFLDENQRQIKETVPWYFKSKTIVIAFLCTGPLALPLIWFNPRLSVTKKLVITGITAIILYFLIIALTKATSSVSEYYDLFSNMEQMLQE